MEEDAQRVAESPGLDQAGPPLRAAEVARALNVSVRSVYAAIERGELRAVRLGRAVRVPREEVARVLRGDPPGGRR